jgi:2-oxo-4-hydroxy-4-carboxy-5-ureidoimidazoline decarboxylase
VNELSTWLNGLSDAEAKRVFHACCAAERWVRVMLTERPFVSSESVLACARDHWREMGQADILEAFQAHPQIGGDLDQLRAKYHTSSNAVNWSAQEQARVGNASDDVLLRLRDGNAAYLRRFGYIFIVCATGKTAQEMLQLLEDRLPNPPEREIEIAALEQEKILLLRLQKSKP